MSEIVVYTFMVADLFHANHVRFLELAKTYGDKLIVGILPDDVVKTFKRTPIYSFDDRTTIVAGLRCVDSVIVQNSRSPLDVIKELLPDIIVHADDWKDNFPDEDKIRSMGVSIIFTPYFEGVSTSNTLNIINMRKDIKSTIS